MANLVIVESPNKINSIQSYLGDEFKVMASVGHIVKLPSSGQYGLGIDIENWEPNFVINPEKKSVIKELKAEVKKSDIVYIATDLDREGEGIADNLVTFLDIKDKYKRITFNSITKETILQAMKNAHLINNDLVLAQKTRRMLDRIIGYRLSKVLKEKISGSPQNPSAGRVQSIALKLVVDKEKEIKAFKPVKFFTLKAHINNDLSLSFYRKKSVNDKNEWIMPKNVDKVKASLENKVTLVEIKTSIKHGKVIEPLKQSALYKYAESNGISSSKTQSAAQRLYEGFNSDGGLISYPRTDSTRLSIGFIKTAQGYIKSKYGEEYINPSIKGSAGAQDAHEAIRPTNINLDPDTANSKYNLSATEYNIYSLIYKRTLQALMTPPKTETYKYDFKSNENLFKFSESKVLFDGYYKIMKDDISSSNLLTLKKGDVLDVEKFEFIEGETKPPARYSEGGLIDKLDQIKVGRPSTYATTIRTIKNRKYVERQGRSLIPTDFGNIINEKLQGHFDRVINEEYTAYVETELDLIAEGKFNHKEALSDFWDRFNVEIDKAVTNMEKTKIEAEKVGRNCPNCGKELLYRITKRTGQKFIGCSGFPECKYVENEDGTVPTPPRESDKNCPKCNGKLAYRTSRYKNREFLGCLNFPKCKYMEDLEGNPIIMAKKKKKIKKKTK